MSMLPRKQSLEINFREREIELIMLRLIISTELAY